jgi:hypothetical protein
MKTPKFVTKFALLFAVLLTVGAAKAQADIIPPVTIDFAPVGITMNQTAELNLLNLNVENGMIINWSFIDAMGRSLAQSSATLPLGKTVSLEFRPNDRIRTEVRVQVVILTPNVPSESLSRSLEVVNNETGATTVCIGGTNQ